MEAERELSKGSEEKRSARGSGEVSSLGGGKRWRVQRLVGEVVSDCMDKTRTLLVRRRVMHPLYHKSITRSKKFLIHDPRNESKVGDVVEVVGCRPISRRKHFRLFRVLKKREG